MNMSPQNPYVEILTPKWWYEELGPGGGTGHEDSALTNGISALKNTSNEQLADAFHYMKPQHQQQTLNLLTPRVVLSNL